MIDSVREDRLGPLHRLAVDQAGARAGKVEVRHPCFLVDTAAVEVDDCPALVMEREDDAVVKGFVTFPVEDADPLQRLLYLLILGEDLQERPVDVARAEVGKAPVVGDAAFVLEVVDPALVQGERVLVVGDHAGEELLFLDGEAGGGLLFGGCCGFCGNAAGGELFNRFRKAHLVEQLDKADGVAARAAAEALVEVFSGIDGEGRGCFSMEGAQADIALAVFLQLDAA